MTIPVKKKISTHLLRMFYFVSLAMVLATVMMSIIERYATNAGPAAGSVGLVSIVFWNLCRAAIFMTALLFISWLSWRKFGFSVVRLSADSGEGDFASASHKRLHAEASARLAELNEMATSIAHEINNPLAIISGYNHVIKMELARQQPRFDKVYKAADSVEVTIHRMAKIISSLRAYARDGSQDPMAISSVIKIVEDAVAMTDSRLKSYGIKLKVSHSVPDALLIRCRKVQILQVLVALIHNAIDAVKNQPAMWIEIDLINKNSQVMLTMTDSGGGIPPEIARRVFEPFFTTKQVGHGPDLGLSVAYGIIKAHGGDIYLDQSCKNTRFVIALSAADATTTDQVA
jgi:C4-dicarboxylate-specific signal transduction histidine kinase